MSRERGNVLQNALAAYLRRWWPHAESAGSGRNGRDILGTPGVWWENKTSSARLRPGEFVRQASESAGLGELPVIVWWPPGVGAKSPAKAIAMLPLPHLMGLLEICGFAPPPTPPPPHAPLPSPTHYTSPSTSTAIPSTPAPPPTFSNPPMPPSPPSHPDTAKTTPTLRLIQGELFQ